MIRQSRKRPESQSILLMIVVYDGTAPAKISEFEPGLVTDPGGKPMEYLSVRIDWNDDRDRVRIDVYHENGSVIASRELGANDWETMPQNTPEALNEWIEIRNLGRPTSEIQYSFS